MFVLGLRFQAKFGCEERDDDFQVDYSYSGVKAEPEDYVDDENNSLVSVASGHLNLSYFFIQSLHPHAVVHYFSSTVK